MSLDSRHRTSFRVLVLAGLIAGTAFTLAGRKVRAQAGSEPFPVMSADRASAFVQAAERKLEYLPGEVLVKFKSGVGAAGQQRALMALRSRPAVTDLKWIAEDTALHRDKSEWDSTILAAQLREQPEVVFAEPNYLRHPQVVPNDPGFSRQWNFTAIDMPRAWDINPGGSSNLTVAVVDTGVTTVNRTYSAVMWTGGSFQSVSVPFATNPDLTTSRLVSPMDFVTGLGSVVVDSSGHGSHVASTIGEDTNDALAETGIAYNVRIMPVKVCESYWELQIDLAAMNVPGFLDPVQFPSACPDDALFQGIHYAADHGANVINVSIGGPQEAPFLLDALNYAVGKGAFVAIAAGNAYQEGNPVQYPAAYASNIDGVMSVAAVGPSLTRAYYSSTGSYVEIAAPGGSDLEGGTNGMIWQSTICRSDSDPSYLLNVTRLLPRFDRYCETPDEGTSMASPHVAGTAALIMSQGVTNPAIVEALIKKSARPLGTGGRTDEYGFGLVQPRGALFGFGIAR